MVHSKRRMVIMGDFCLTAAWGFTNAINATSGDATEVRDASNQGLNGTHSRPNAAELGCVRPTTATRR